MIRPCRNGADRAERHEGAYFFLAFFFVAFFFIVSPPSRSRASRAVAGCSWTLGEGGNAVKGKIHLAGAKGALGPYILGRGEMMTRRIRSFLERRRASYAPCASRIPGSAARPSCRAGSSRVDRSGNPCSPD